MQAHRGVGAGQARNATPGIKVPRTRSYRGIEVNWSGRIRARIVGLAALGALQHRVPSRLRRTEEDMSAVLLAVFDEYQVAERVRVELVRHGFPTDRIELTAGCEPGRAGPRRIPESLRLAH